MYLFVGDYNDRGIEGSIAGMIIALRHNKYIQEKKSGNISSFNYTDQAFSDKAWNRQTVRARGLYLDTVKSRVVARACDSLCQRKRVSRNHQL